MQLLYEEAYIARIYYESMRDNFEGYGWDLEPSNPKAEALHAKKSKMLDDLRKAFEDMDPLEGKKPSLGQLFKIELALIWLIPDSALKARYWTIEDRFRRVVPNSVAASYDKSLTGSKGPAGDEASLRQRARNLLDVIHANYLINLGRENTIKRMMTILAIATTFILAIATVLIFAIDSLAWNGLVLIVVTGMFGAMISIIQRLQKATSRDAMVEDGIFELIGLRVGWVSVMMSIAIGGVFALFLYVLVVANMIELVLPDVTGNADPGVPGDDGAMIEETPETAAPDEIVPPVDPAEPPDPAAPVLADPVAAPADPGAPMAAPAAAGSAPPAASANGVTSCQEAAASCKMWSDKVATALGLDARASFYKMIATAFVAGFAERFVPDIINRLGKQNPGPDAMRTGGS